MRKINWISLILQIAIVGLACLDNFVFVGFFGETYAYVAPVIWLSVAVGLYVFYKKQKSINNINQKFEYVIIFAILNLVTIYIYGVLYKFQYSAYSHTFIGIFKNFCQFILIAVAFEMIRQSFVSNERTKFDRICSVVFMVILNTNLVQFIGIFKNGLSFSYLFGVILTCIVNQIFLNFLVRNCGLRSTLLWVLLPAIVEILSPILPKIEWFYALLFAILWSLMYFVLFYYTYTNKNTAKEIRLSKRRKPYGTIITFVSIFLIIGFFTGMFGVFPTTIASNSMNPYFYRGDMVVIHRMKEYNVNDVIQYKHENIKIVHRITDKFIENNKIVYVTKGDNNNANDSWVVLESQIEGKVEFVLPKIGYLALWVSELF